MAGMFPQKGQADTAEATKAEAQTETSYTDATGTFSASPIV